jgi:hypothetical protein
MKPKLILPPTEPTLPEKRTILKKFFAYQENHPEHEVDRRAFLKDYVDTIPKVAGRLYGWRAVYGWLVENNYLAETAVGDASVIRVLAIGVEFWERTKPVVPVPAPAVKPVKPVKPSIRPEAETVCAGSSDIDVSFQMMGKLIVYALYNRCKPEELLEALISQHIPDLTMGMVMAVKKECLDVKGKRIVDALLATAYLPLPKLYPMGELTEAPEDDPFAPKAERCVRQPELAHL